MKVSTILRNRKIASLLAILIWIAIWQVASIRIGEEMLLASPAAVLKTLWSLIFTTEFWKNIVFSLSRIITGFAGAFVISIPLAALAYRFKFIEIFLNPLMAAAKAAPVASYIILFLLFFSSGILSLVTALTMAIPMLYANILQGLSATDKKLLEMAKVFHMPKRRTIVYVYISELMPFIISACSVALGYSWKAAIAAEVIALPLGSIGEQIYQAKIFLDTKTLLAWTLVLVCISFALEKLILIFLKSLTSNIERS
ncbi:MAG: ABC transporter permease subunit [Treponema sp.]|jgi:NitT/TauT family transport system permease protein|nr:ABC transporter permease subunit [Treponema sp.]